MNTQSSCCLAMVGLRLKRAISLGEIVAAHERDLGLNTCSNNVSTQTEREGYHTLREEVLEPGLGSVSVFAPAFGGRLRL